MAQHAGHVDTVPVHVLEEDICISSGQSASLTEISTVIRNRFGTRFMVCFDSAACYLEKGLLLLQMFTNHGSHVVCFTVRSQFVSPSAPVLFSLILLFQALQHTANL